MQFRAVDRVGNKSTPATYSFGVPAVTEPTAGGTTLRHLPLAARAPAAATAVRFQYRTAATQAWADIPASAVKVGQTPVTWPVATVANGGAAAAPAGLTWDMPATLGTDASVQLQAVFTGGASATTANSATARLDSHAYGLSYATTDTPAGPVSLLTGNLAVSGSDASVVSFGGGLGITRTFNSIDPTYGAAASVFGPGWSTSVTSSQSDWAGADDLGPRSASPTPVAGSGTSPRPPPATSPSMTPKPRRCPSPGPAPARAGS